MVHFTLRGFLFILKFLWHFDRQNLKICNSKDHVNIDNNVPKKHECIIYIKKNTFASFLTNWIPCPGYTVDEQNQHFSNLIAKSFNQHQFFSETNRKWSYEWSLRINRTFSNRFFYLHSQIFTSKYLVLQNLLAI